MDHAQSPEIDDDKLETSNQEEISSLYQCVPRFELFLDEEVTIAMVLEDLTVASFFMDYGPKVNTVQDSGIHVARPSNVANLVLVNPLGGAS